MWPALELKRTANGQPFCAGVCVWGQRGPIFTLGKRKRWRRDASGRLIIPICWVGGGQEPSEDIEQCALREASEELGRPVRLRSSAVTHWFDLSGTREHAVGRCHDAIAPIIAERRLGLSQPYKPGLPTGRYVYVAIYLAECLGSPARGDVPGLIEVEAAQSPRFRRGLLVSDVQAGAWIWRHDDEIPLDAILKYEADGPEQQLAGLLETGALRQ